MLRTDADGDVLMTDAPDSSNTTRSELEGEDAICIPEERDEDIDMVNEGSVLMDDEQGEGAGEADEGYISVDEDHHAVVEIVIFSGAGECIVGSLA